LKAIEYYEKYEKCFFPAPKKYDEVMEASKNLIHDLNKEAFEHCEKNNFTRDSEVLAVLLDQNGKWNAIDTLFKIINGVSPLLSDGFIKFWEHKIPELKRQDAYDQPRSGLGTLKGDKTNEFH
jgi:hypothetical protein